MCHLVIQCVLFSKTENEAQQEERMAQQEERMAQPEPPLGSTHSSLCPSPLYTMLERIAKQLNSPPPTASLSCRQESDEPNTILCHFLSWPCLCVPLGPSSERGQGTAFPAHNYYAGQPRYCQALSATQQLQLMWKIRRG